MRKKKWTTKLKSLILLVGLASCSSFDPTPPPEYQVYILRVKENKLNAKTELGDLPLTVCADTSDSKANCYVFLKKEYQKLMHDLVERDIKLKACEAVPPLGLQL